MPATKRRAFAFPLFVALLAGCAPTPSAPPTPSRLPAPRAASPAPSCPQASSALVESRRLADQGHLDRALGTLGLVTDACASPQILAARLELRLALDDLTEAASIAHELLAQDPPEPIAKVAREALARPRPAESVDDLRALVAEAKRRDADTIEANRLRDRALHLLERLGGEPAVLDAFEPSYEATWIGDRGWYEARSQAAGDTRVVALSLDRAEGVVTPRFAVRGAALSPTIDPQGERLLLHDAEGLLYHRTLAEPPKRLAARWGRFVPGTDTVVTVTPDAIELHDARGDTTKRMPIRHAPETVKSRLLDDGRAMALWGDCLAEHDEGSVCVVLLDLEAGAVRLDAAAVDVALSSSGRYVGLAFHRAPKATTEAWATFTVAVFDRHTGRLGAETALGAVTTTWKLQFGPRERRLVVYEPGLSGLNMYTARTLVAAVDVATGRKASVPTLAQITPHGAAERWTVLEPRLRHLARAPRRLVPTARGPGRSLGFAETADERTLALLEGIVAPAWAGVTTKDPVVLLVDATRRRVTKRVPLPVEPDTVFGTARMELGPDDRSLWICLAGEPRAQLLLDLQTAALTPLAPGEGCYDWTFSADGGVGYDDRRVVDLKAAREIALPLAARGDTLAKATPTDPWLHCRAGPIVVPAAICREP